MAETNGSVFSSQLLQKLSNFDYLAYLKDQGPYGVVGAITVAILIPLLLSILFGKKKVKRRGVPVKVSGEDGLAMRNGKFKELVVVPWEGATTVAALFEQSCKKHRSHRCLGTRKVIEKEFVESNGRKFEKMHLGEYQWETYGQVFERACNFGFRILKLGHDVNSRVAIFSEKRVEWLIALQGCLRQNVTVVNMCASLARML